MRKIKPALQKCFSFSVVFVMLFVPLLGAYAQDAILQNPLSNIDSIPQFISRLLDLAMMAVLPFVAVLLAYAGFLFISAQGNLNQITKARNVLLWTCIGAAVVLGAKLFAMAIEGTIDSLR